MRACSILAMRKTVVQLPLSAEIEAHFTARAGRVEAESLRRERTPLIKLVRWWKRVGNDAPASKLTPVDWEDFLAVGLEQESAGGSIMASSYNQYISSLGHFAGRMHRRSIWSAAHLELLNECRRKTSSRTFVRMSIDQLHDAIDSARDPYDRWAIALGVYSLGRESELLLGRVQDVDDKSSAPSVDWKRPKVKDFSDRVPMVAELVYEYRLWCAHYAEMLGRELLPADYLIPTRQRILKKAGEYTWRYDPTAARSSLGTVIKPLLIGALGDGGEELLQGQACHTMRRSAARVLYDQLVEADIQDPIRIVMAMLGHRNQRTTEIYLGITRDRERRDAALAGSSFMGRPDRARVLRLA